MAKGREQDGRPPRLSEEQQRLYEELYREAEKRSEKRKKEKKNSRIRLTAVFAVFIAALICISLIKKPVVYPADGELQVHFIDVGQGDCIYITTSGGNMLIDCGESDRSGAVTAYLREHGVKRLDRVIGTHPHSDHMGGMSAIIENFDIGEFIIPHLDDEDIPATVYFMKFLEAVEKYGVELTEAVTGSEFEIGDAHCEIIAPSSDKYDDVNDYSVSVILRHGERSFLFTGDAERFSEQEMISSGRLTHIDVYKAGHHGSSSSSSVEFMRIVRPKIAVISCGAENPYGHPSDEAVSRIARYTDKIYRTDLCGTIIISSDGETLTVEAERKSR